MKYPREKLLDELKKAGLSDLEIEEARISFEKGIKILVKMYYDYESNLEDQDPHDYLKKAG